METLAKGAAETVHTTPPAMARSEDERVASKRELLDSMPVQKVGIILT
jgi:hypothetical protein